ncbi:CobW family GTP-binding protein [Shewanella sp. GXUN23E]|uniref:CobW family GTP-binding protein n=1 Tax=Shewanella sp. GXUN23E TaxID=3422498 RepID=UPI003D7C649C
MKIQSVPVNVITGFLGSGKTSFIQRLLASKPEDERWAVLINEFGEIGLDAALLGRSAGDEVVVREVAGGCMCCAAGVPTQVAVTQILTRARPDRLLIEPTGLGHPDEILKLLRSEFLANVLNLRATLCLVDASRLKDTRYTEHEIFRRQLAVADLVLASKADSYDEQPLQQLAELLDAWSLADTPVYAISEQWPLEREMVKAIQLPAKVPVAGNPVVSSAASSGAQVSKSVGTSLSTSSSTSDSNNRPMQASSPRREPSLLTGATGAGDSWLFAPRSDEVKPVPLHFDEHGMIEKANAGDGFYSLGWIFRAEHCFDFDRLMQLLQSVNVARLKAVVITLDGIAAFNLADGRLRVSELDETLDSRIEFIDHRPLDAEIWRARVLACLTDH